MLPYCSAECIARHYFVHGQTLLCPLPADRVDAGIVLTPVRVMHCWVHCQTLLCEQAEREEVSIVLTLVESSHLGTCD